LRIDHFFKETTFTFAPRHAAWSPMRAGFPEALSLLIDGDNTSHDLLPQLLRLLGPEVEGRVLCNPCSHSGWAGALSRIACRITLIRVPSRDKNAVDDRLMDLMRAGPADLPVLLVSRDADFSPCVEALERAGTPVICLSTEPPAVRLRRACSGWVELLRSGEAHYHARIRLQDAAGSVESRPSSGKRRGRTVKVRPDGKAEGAVTATASAARRVPPARTARGTVDLDRILKRLLDEEGVTPLARLEALCAAEAVPQGGLLGHLRSRPDLYHVAEEADRIRVSPMSPERALFTAIEKALRAAGPLPLSRLMEAARGQGLVSSKLPRRSLLVTLQARPDLFRITGDGDAFTAELVA
jgi:hypothetical protein